MNPWLILGIILAGVYFLIDLLVRRTKWNDNTKAEKNSVVLGMICMTFYIFFSFAGMLYGVLGAGSDPIEKFLYESAVFLGYITWIVALVVTIGSIVLRKLGKTRESLMIHIAGIGIIVLQLALLLSSEIFF